MPTTSWLLVPVVMGLLWVLGPYVFGIEVDLLPDWLDLKP